MTAPTQSAKKDEIVEWLLNQGAAQDDLEGLTKPELLDLVGQYAVEEEPEEEPSEGPSEEQAEEVLPSSGLLTVEQAAEKVGLSVDDLMRSRGRGLAPGKFGFKKDGALVFNASDLETQT